ncbi:MAG: DUF1553 domain-containing protein [Verrucomicrobia bacterium]|nr:DUF1553 domain-containing protein [Verrucomicrobiota bacterium]
MSKLRNCLLLAALLAAAVDSAGQEAKTNSTAKSPRSLDWWSLKPLVRPPLPKLKPSDAKWVRTPVDTFILTKLHEKGLAPSAEADRRTLIRRLTFDLHGLPPTPEEVEAFVADKEPFAYERLVDRLLASPRYGERWARHWLDVAHYGESNGFGMDRPRLNAWPYRDYVIAAFNSDKPYARFVQEQIAADVLFRDDVTLTAALGFAAAGPFNQSALAEQVDGTDCKRMALNLDRDDMVASVAASFLSLTVHCARCHDHKFDPIQQRDYYRLQAVFAGVGRAEREFDPDPQVHARRVALKQLKSAVEKNHGTPLTTEEQSHLATAQTEWERKVAGEGARWQTLEITEVKTQHGTALTNLGDGSLLVANLKSLPERDIYTLTARVPTQRLTAVRLEVLPHDSLSKKGPGTRDNGNLHLSEFGVATIATDASAMPVRLALQNPTADFNQEGWGIERALDGKTNTAWGIYPEIGKRHEAVFELKQPATNSTALVFTLEQLHGGRHLIGRLRLSATANAPPVRASTLPADIVEILGVPAPKRIAAQSDRLAQFYRLLRIDQQLAALPAPQKVWSIAADFPAFRNYKPSKEPQPVSVLRRGDIKQPAETVASGALDCVTTLRAEFDLPNPKDEGARRAAFAKWLIDPANMLAWRSIVNRVWHWHFGRGIVQTPNDFGRMGSVPSHPELLDWLACEFRDTGGSMKSLHRLIVCSSAYRQASAVQNKRAPALDSDNRFLWRMNRARLDAESVRDAVLSVSGKLDLTMGGPGVMQFKFDDPNKEVSPRIDYDAFDPDSPASLRRGVYRFLFRNINDPLLETFDAVDPSLSTPKRNATITPLQSLSLLNNRFVLRQCEHLAARLEREVPDTHSCLERAFRLVFARPPTPADFALFEPYVEKHGLANACRVLFNSNEFLFVN